MILRLILLIFTLIFSNISIANSELLNLRRMTLSDVAAVYKVERTLDGDWDRKLLTNTLHACYESWVLVKNSEVIGFGILTFDAKGAYILKLGIAPQFQAQGMGTALLRQLIDRSKAAAPNVRLLVRVSNFRAINLYEKFKFNVTGKQLGYYRKRDQSPAEDALIMYLQFSS